MAKERLTIGKDGIALPVMPPDRDGRVWAKMVRVMFYTPGFIAILLLKTGEPTSFGITVELLILSSATAVVAGLFVGSQSDMAGADHASRIGLWCGALVLELLAVVPFICAVPPLFHELANSKLLHSAVAGSIDIPLGLSELLPAMAIVPFMLYQLAGFGTLHFVVPKWMNWVLNAIIFGLIMGSYVANRHSVYDWERHLVGALVVIMAVTVVYGVLKLKAMQIDFDARCPPNEKKSAS